MFVFLNPLNKGGGRAQVPCLRIESDSIALLIEGGHYGTTCARVGCMPSKLLIAAAEAAHGAKHGGVFGLNVPVSRYH